MTQASASNVRVMVIKTLLDIQQGRSLNTLLDPLLNRLGGEDRGFAHALLLTTLRHWYATARLLDSLADQPIDEAAVRTTIQLGITQLLYLHVADHAAINETVAAIKKLELTRASGLVNAILRKVAKSPNKFRKKANKNHSLPNWLAQQIKADWREQYNELTQSLRQVSPIFLRVNTIDSNDADYLDKLTQSGIKAALMTLNTSMKTVDTDLPSPISQSVIQLEDSVLVSSLPGFESGSVSIQDAHAQLAAPLLHHILAQSIATDNLHNPGITAGSHALKLRLLDACAAPGGKLAHWLELIEGMHKGVDESQKFHVKQKMAEPMAVTVNMTAIDSEPKRISRIFENLERLKLPRGISKPELDLNIVCADATSWQAPIEAESGFDAILLDAPCSATGVIRRHPDITLLRTQEDVVQTVKLQAKILDNLWPQLNKGGYLLYVTCSILKCENIEQIQAFLARHSDAQAIPFDDSKCNWGLSQKVGRQCLPIFYNDLKPDEIRPSGDGFYFALLKKTEALDANDSDRNAKQS